MASTTTASDVHAAGETLPAHVHVAIVGTGFGGIGAAVRLLQEGFDDFVLLERAEDLGGTWRDNSYPGCACDVPSHLYSFSFAPNPEWTRAFSPQAEIWDYLRRVSSEYSVSERIVYGAEVRNAVWDEDSQLWTVETARGELTANIVIGAMGGLADPAFPEIKGLDSFTGRVFHSAQWDHDHQLEGERVAVIGTGASAIQFVPRIAADVERVDLYQRTPPWIVPKPNRELGRLRHTLYRRFPALQRLVRSAVYWRQEALVPGFVINPKLQRLVQAIAKRHLAHQVKDPVLRDKLTPRYTIGCKRILQANDYYPAVSRENVDVITDAIAEITPGGIIDADGVHREVDTIILATGFHVTDRPIGQRLRGVGGLTLDDVWQGSPKAYYGTTIAGFPNLFMLLGPNTGLGHSSIIYMIEAQVEHIVSALKTMADNDLGAINVKADVMETHNAELQRRMERTVWNSGGCQSWYIDATGRNSTLWPDFTFRFRQQVTAFDPSVYELQPRRVDVPQPVAA